MLPKASVVPAVVAPSSPCMASCGTPQSPCNFAYSNDWAWARLHSAGEVLIWLSMSIISPVVVLCRFAQWLDLRREIKLDAWVGRCCTASLGQLKADQSSLWTHRCGSFQSFLCSSSFAYIQLMIHNHVQLALCCLFRVLRCSVHVAFLDFFRKNLDPVWPFERPRPCWHQPQSQAPEFLNGVALLESDGIRWFVLSLVMS